MSKILKPAFSMIRIVFTLSLVGIVFYGYAQNEAKSEEITSPIMLDFLKNYQQNNTVQKIEGCIPLISFLSKRVIEGDKNTKIALENINNMIVVKPNLVEIMRMPVIRPNENTHHIMRIVNSDTNKLQPIK